MGQLFIRDVDGSTLPIVADPGADVASLKEQIAQARGLPVDEQRLSYGGRSLAASEQLSAYGITDESTIFLSLELLGGVKKRKKKTYTKPKKVKLAVLKFYKVDSSDKVTRLRRECPHELCGPGVFMAMHFNRYYCGKCHLTYLIKKGE